MVNNPLGLTLEWSGAANGASREGNASGILVPRGDEDAFDMRGEDARRGQEPSVQALRDDVPEAVNLPMRFR